MPQGLKLLLFNVVWLSRLLLMFNQQSFGGWQTVKIPSRSRATLLM
jgi:hypothetical protein